MLTLISTLWSFVSSSKKNAAIGIGGVLLVSAVIGGLLYIVYDYSAQARIAAEAKAEAATWKANYEQAVQVNAENLTTIKTLQSAASKFEGILKDREQQIDTINQEILDKEERIEQLRRENDQVRADLEYVISCRLWREIFPGSTICPDKDGSSANQGSGKPSTAVPGATGAKK